MALLIGFKAATGSAALRHSSAFFTYKYSRLCGTPLKFEGNPNFIQRNKTYT